MTRKTRHSGQKSIKFAGDLATPIMYTPPTRPSLAVLELYPEAKARYEHEVKEARSKVIAEAFRKLSLLQEHYDLMDADPEVRNILLLLQLCRDFVPGFAITPAKQQATRGAPRKWNAKDYTALWADVETVRQKRKCSDLEACRELVQTHPKYKPTGRATRAKWKIDKEASTLRARLSEARKAQSNILASFADKMLSDERLAPIFLDLFASTENIPE